MLDGAKWGNKHNRVGSRAVQCCLELLKKLICSSSDCILVLLLQNMQPEKEKIKLNISSYDNNLHSLETFCWHCGRLVWVYQERERTPAEQEEAWGVCLWMKPEISLQLFHIYWVIRQMIVPVTTSATDPTLPCKCCLKKWHIWTWISVCGQIIHWVVIKTAPLKLMEISYSVSSSPMNGIYWSEWQTTVADSNWAPLMVVTVCLPSVCPWEWWELLPQHHDHLRVSPDGELVRFLTVCLQHHKTQIGQNTAQNKASLWQDLYFQDLACSLLPFFPSWQTAIITQMTYIRRPRIINN